jgi:hypothetical protein
MKRFSWIVLPVLVLMMVAPVPPFALTASAYGWVVFTTVNPAVDGAGHCISGDPSINCYLYGGKDFVWLNGAPKYGSLGPDGQYFFAVLGPGAQFSSNDGGMNNLSDDFDAYTNRTFTVTDGKVSAYSGTHWLDSGSHAQGAADNTPPYIRLSPYAEPPTPPCHGCTHDVVYKLALCSLAAGYPVDATACRYAAFKVREPICQPKTITPDFTRIPAGTSVEGLGTVVAELNIDAQHTAVSLAPGIKPMAYNANGPSGKIINGGMDPTGGFSDIQAHSNSQAHHYTFTFAPGVSVSDFKVHMLDYGDLNPKKNKAHLVTITAYNASGAVVAKQTLSYNTNALSLPTKSNLYGNPQITGDAITGKPGKPGNWLWHVTGPGIVRVQLDFGVGYDPNIALDVMTFVTECPPCP